MPVLPVPGKELACHTTMSYNDVPQNKSNSNRTHFEIIKFTSSLIIELRCTRNFLRFYRAYKCF